MANLSTNKLNDIYLSTFMSDTDQIVKYVEEISANLIEKIDELEPEIDLTNYLSKTEGREISSNLNNRLSSIEDDYLSKTECREISSNLNNRLSSIEDDYLSKTEGGEISGNVAIKNSHLNLFNSNYVQANDLEHVVNYSSKNSFLQAEYVEDHTEYGVACTGSKGFCIISCMHETDTIKLSGDIHCLKDFIDANPNAVFSYALASGSDSSILSVSAIDVDNQTVTFKNDLLSSTFKPSYTEEVLIDMFYTDDNAFYCPQHPELGNIEIYSFYGNHAEGGATKALGKYTHAEGRNTIADARYSHVEGDGCKALGQASHAEGIRTSANGKYAHAEGYACKSLGQASHSEGGDTNSSGQYAHSEGRKTSANGEYSHAEGNTSKANGSSSHAEGYNTIASGDYSHAEGWTSYAYGRGSIAAGIKAKTEEKHYTSFVWQGFDNSELSSSIQYKSKAVGSFNINPVNGLKGFYIGKDNFVQCVLSAVQMMSETQKNELKTVLGLKS